MKKGWLKSMLTPAKQESELWDGWADVVEKMLGDNVEPIIQRIDARKSFFSMGREDLNKRVNELGQFFAIRSKNEASKPVLLSQRLDEIHFKGTERPISATFWREFENIPAQWEPLYAPVDQTAWPYGSFFTTSSGIQYSNQKYGEFYLTSRGMISLSINALYSIYGAAKQADLVKRIQSQFEEVIQPLLPLDIVFDGFLLYMDYTLFEYAPDLILKTIESTADYTGTSWKERPGEITQYSTVYSLPLFALAQAIRPVDVKVFRFDEIPLDAWQLDMANRPNIYPKLDPNDKRMVIGANATMIDTMGAQEIQIQYEGGPTGSRVVDYPTGMPANNIFQLNIPAADAAFIVAVAYSLT